MSDKRPIVKAEISPKTHEAFKKKCGARGMKDRIRILIAADVEGILTINKDSKK